MRAQQYNLLVNIDQIRDALGIPAKAHSEKEVLQQWEKALREPGVKLSLALTRTGDPAQGTIPPPAERFNRKFAAGRGVTGDEVMESTDPPVSSSSKVALATGFLSSWS